MFRLSQKEINQKEIREQKKKYLSTKTSFDVVKKVWKYAKPHRYLMILTFLFDLINSIAELLVPVYLGFAINACIGAVAVDFNLVTYYVLIMLIIVLVA